jgi:aminoglycoside phosphotransferase
MILDQTAVNPTFTEGRVPDQVDALVEWLRGEMKVEADREWTIVSARRKFGKELVEIEEQRPEGPFRMIVKVGKPHRIKLNYEALELLWNAGFHPPAKFTVPQPIAYFPERDLLVQEKAPGEDLLTRMLKGDEVEEAAALAAEWLARVHDSGVPIEQWKVLGPPPSQLAEELASILKPEVGREVVALYREAEAYVKSQEPELVPAHGDYHPHNVLLCKKGRVTGIDVDKFGTRDRTEEVAYALAQIACIGYQRAKGFETSRLCRQAFLGGYERASGRSLDRSRIGATMALTILSNLHFDLYAFKTGKTELVEPWLHNAASCLEGNLQLCDLR